MTRRTDIYLKDSDNISPKIMLPAAENLINYTEQNDYRPFHMIGVDNTGMKGASALAQSLRDAGLGDREFSLAMMDMSGYVGNDGLRKTPSEWKAYRGAPKDVALYLIVDKVRGGGSIITAFYRAARKLGLPGRSGRLHRLKEGHIPGDDDTKVALFGMIDNPAITQQALARPDDKTNYYGMRPGEKPGSTTPIETYILSVGGEKWHAFLAEEENLALLRSRVAVYPDFDHPMLVPADMKKDGRHVNVRTVGRLFREIEEMTII